MWLFSTAAVGLLASSASASYGRYHQEEPSSSSSSEPQPPLPAGECQLVGGDSASCFEKPTQQQQHYYQYHVDSSSSSSSNSHKQQLNHTQNNREGGLKHASKETESVDDDDASQSGTLLKWLSHKMVPESKQCGVYLAPSTIPGAGLGMFAGRDYKPREIVTEGDIVIPLSEIDWHNGFQLDFFLWEEYTWRYVLYTQCDSRSLFFNGREKVVFLWLWI